MDKNPLQFSGSSRSLSRISIDIQGARTRIQLRQVGEQVAVEVSDKGKGIPRDKLEEMSMSGTPGVGIRGMRERLRQLGGALEIESAKVGTVVSVILPLERGASQEGLSVVDHEAA